MTSDPRFAPSIKNWTPAMPRLSEALAVSVVVPRTAAPLVGLVIATDGVTLELLTVTLTGAEVAMLPEVSVAIAERVWAPAVAVVVFHARA